MIKATLKKEHLIGLLTLSEVSSLSAWQGHGDLQANVAGTVVVHTDPQTERETGSGIGF